MFALKPEKPVTEICGKVPLILLVKLKVSRKIFFKKFSGSTLKERIISANKAIGEDKVCRETIPYFY